MSSPAGKYAALSDGNWWEVDKGSGIFRQCQKLSSTRLKSLRRWRNARSAALIKGACLQASQIWIELVIVSCPSVTDFFSVFRFAFLSGTSPLRIGGPRCATTQTTINNCTNFFNFWSLFLPVYLWNALFLRWNLRETQYCLNHGLH